MQNAVVFILFIYLFIYNKTFKLNLLIAQILFLVHHIILCIGFCVFCTWCEGMFRVAEKGND